MKYIPVEKRSKKVQRELAKSRRGGWGPLNPVTRKPENPKAYSRKRTRRDWKIDDGSSFLFFIYRSEALKNSSSCASETPMFSMESRRLPFMR